MSFCARLDLCVQNKDFAMLLKGLVARPRPPRSAWEEQQLRAKRIQLKSIRNLIYITQVWALTKIFAFEVVLKILSILM